MKNLILILDGEYYQFDTLDELKEFFIPDFKSKLPEIIEKYMYEKIFGFSIMNDLQILNTNKGVYGGDFEICEDKINIEKAIIIDNLDTYIVSLCKYNVITLLEEKNNRFYTKNIEFEPRDDNYIFVNSFATEILHNMVGDIK